MINNLPIHGIMIRQSLMLLNHQVNTHTNRLLLHLLIAHIEHRHELVIP